MLTADFALSEEYSTNWSNKFAELIELRVQFMLNNRFQDKGETGY
jgi:hypothetical protein